MFCMRFYNNVGEIIFGGGKSSSPWKITACDGLAFCPKNIITVSYAGQNGRETTQVVSTARVITLSGDIFLGNGREALKEGLCVLEEDGYLEISIGDTVRKIKARCCEFKEGDRKGKFLLFTVQFECDSPFFEDLEAVTQGVFGVIGHLDNDFTFPGALSTRISHGRLNYSGTVKTQPIFRIKVGESFSGEDILSITNHTSGECLSFNFAEIENELVTIDVENRKITNSEGESLLRYLADDSFFDGFYLYPGENDIEVLNVNMNTGIEVVITYKNLYSEAVNI